MPLLAMFHVSCLLTLHSFFDLGRASRPMHAPALGGDEDCDIDSSVPADLRAHYIHSCMQRVLGGREVGVMPYGRGFSRLQRCNPKKKEMSLKGCIDAEGAYYDVSTGMCFIMQEEQEKKCDRRRLKCDQLDKAHGIDLTKIVLCLKDAS
mmetsp:Transcript_18769/g.35224  ORF Transcript_18769/g.35224 Transcript_18769/m.35224 type:complete len:150 (-) Transcript_18769:144-593(-)